MNIGLYRDDGLLVTIATPRQLELIKKRICAIFGDHGLKITADSNLKTVDFLDTTFSQEKGTYSPYNKPNKTWKDFGFGLEISLYSSLRDRVKWDLGLGVNC